MKLHINQLAERTGLRRSVVTNIVTRARLGHYPDRLPNGWREFSDADAEQVAAIHRLALTERVPVPLAVARLRRAS